MLAALRADSVVRTQEYDGPLELLLYLVRRDGLDVLNLPIVHITREYLAFLDQVQSLDLDEAGEFLVMAATLCELKSRELLPRLERPVEEDEEDPRQALARRIIEYQRYKEAAEGLDQRLWLDRDVFRRLPDPGDPREVHVVAGVDAFGLLEIYGRVLERHQRSRPVHEVQREQIRWVDCVRWVLSRLDDGETHAFDAIMADLPSRPARVLSFLAILELCRMHMVDIHQRLHLAPVLVRGLVRLQDADLSAFEAAS